MNSSERRLALIPLTTNFKQGETWRPVEKIIAGHGKRLKFAEPKCYKPGDSRKKQPPQGTPPRLFRNTLIPTVDEVRPQSQRKSAGRLV